MAQVGGRRGTGSRGEALGLGAVNAHKLRAMVARGGGVDLLLEAEAEKEAARAELGLWRKEEEAMWSAGRGGRRTTGMVGEDPMEAANLEDEAELEKGAMAWVSL